MKPLRLLYFCDLHVRGTSPRARTDNYLEAITGKLRWVVARLNEFAAEGPAAGICGGDLFDSPDASYSVTGLVAEILREAQAEILAIAGNHDLYGYNPETLGRTPLGLLVRLGLLRLLKPNEGYCLPDYGVRITGRGFDWDVDKSIDDYAQKADGVAAIRIHVVHGMAVEQPLPGMVRHTLLQEVRNTDLVLTGHEHIGYGHKMHGRTSWINPGALGRLTAHVEELGRQPRVAVISCLPLDDKRAPDWEVEFADVPCKPGPEARSRDALQEIAAREERITEFLELLRAESAAAKLLDVPALLTYLAEQHQIPQTIVSEALRRIELARQDLAGRRSV